MPRSGTRKKERKKCIVLGLWEPSGGSRNHPGGAGEVVSAQASPVSLEGQARVSQGLLKRDVDVPGLMDDSPADCGEVGWAVVGSDVFQVIQNFSRLGGGVVQWRKALMSDVAEVESYLCHSSAV